MKLFTMFQATFVAFETGHRLRWVRKQHEITNGELVSIQSKFKQSQDRIKVAQAKLATHEEVIANTNDKYNRLLAEKTRLEERARMLEEDNKVIKAVAHLKTKVELFKEYEQHGGSEWDVQAAYDAWESFLACKDDTDDEEDGEDDDENAEAEKDSDTKTADQNDGADGGH